jgi:hypothetical protein
MKCGAPASMGANAPIEAAKRIEQTAITAN